MRSVLLSPRRRGLVAGDGTFAEQILTQFFVQPRHFAAQPLQYHSSVLDFFIPIVFQNLLEHRVLAGVGALLVPVNRFKLLHQRGNGPVDVHGFRGQGLEGFMQSFMRHNQPLWANE